VQATPDIVDAADEVVRPDEEIAFELAEAEEVKRTFAGAERGAIAGAAELADGHLFDDEDRERLISIVPAGMTIAVLLLEHLWLLPLLQAIERAEGFELKNEWVDAGMLAAIGIEATSRDPN